MINPDVRRKAELFTDGEVTSDLLHAMAHAHGLPLHRVPVPFEARPKRGYDPDELRALLQAAEFRYRDLTRQSDEARKEVMRLRMALGTELDRQARS